MAGVQRRLVERWDAAAWLEVVGRNQGLYTKNLCTWVEVAKRQEAQGKPTKNYLRPDIWLVSAVNSTLIVISFENEDWKSCQGRCLEWEERSNACPCDNYTWGEDDRSDWILLILSLCLWELFPIWSTTVPCPGCLGSSTLMVTTDPLMLSRRVHLPGPFCWNP